MFSVIRVGRKTRDLVGYVKVNWKPPANVGDQSSPKLTPTLFASLPYAQKKESWLGLIFAEGQVPDCPRRHMSIKMNSHPGIITYAVSQDIYIYIYIHACL